MERLEKLREGTNATVDKGESTINGSFLKSSMIDTSALLILNWISYYT